MRAIFRLSHAVADFHHIHIIPMAGASVFAQNGLFIEDGQHLSCSLLGQMVGNIMNYLLDRLHRIYFHH